MGRVREKGEARLSSLIAFVVLVAFGLAAWNLVPVYFAHYDFVDKVNEICRTPAYKARFGDKSIMDMLMKEVQERRLGKWIGPESFLITSSTSSRQIELYYEREVEILPGFKRTLKFSFKADQPLI